MSRVIQMIGGHPAFWCPACQHPHWLDERWKWNGDRDRPTFSPRAPGVAHSYLSYSPEHTQTSYLLKRNEVWFKRDSLPVKESEATRFGQKDYAERVAAEHAADNEGAGWGVVTRTVKHPRKVYCHSYITDGSVRYLDDTPKPWGGKTVALKPWSAQEDGSYTGPE